MQPLSRKAYVEIEWPSSEVIVTGTTFSRTRVFALLTPARLTTVLGISLVGLPLLACGEVSLDEPSGGCAATCFGKPAPESLGKSLLLVSLQILQYP